MKTMKKISMILSATLAVFALASCKQDININPADGETVVGSIPFELAASADEFATRTALDATTWNVTWESATQRPDEKADSIYAVTTDAEWGKPYADDKKAATVAAFGYNGSTFSTESTISDGEHIFYFVYSNNSQKSYHRAGGTTNQLAGTQSMDAAAPTAGLRAYDALAGKGTFTTPTTIASVLMSHLYSLMKVTLKNQTGADMTVTSFSMSVDDGAFLSGISDVDFTGTTPVATYSKSGSNSVTVNITNGEIKAGATLDVYFVILPLTNYSGGVTFQVATASDTYTKTNTVSALSFAAGSHNSASYTLKNADGKVTEPVGKTGWYRVEDASWLKVGDRVAIVGSTEAKALSIAQNSNNRRAAVITKGTDGDYATITQNDSLQVFVLEAGSVTGSYAFWTDNGDIPGQYIYSPVKSSNYLRTRPAVNDSASFAISVANHNATVLSQGKDVRPDLRFNPGSYLFSCYETTTSQKPVEIYKQYGAATPTLEAPEISVEGTTVTITASADATIYYTVDGSAPTAASTEYTGTFEISGPTTVKAIAVRKHYNASEVATEALSPTGATVATPEITSSNNTFTITCSTPEASILYATSTTSADFTPTTWVAYTAPVAYTATTYVKAKGVKTGYTDSEIASATCTYNASGDFSNIAELKAKITSETAVELKGTLSGVIVTYVNGSNAFLKDATGSILFYNSDHGLKQGQTFTGSIDKLKAKEYKGLREITEIDFAEGDGFEGDEAAVSPVTVTLADLFGHYDDYESEYVKVENLVSGTSATDARSTIDVSQGEYSYKVYTNVAIAVNTGDVFSATGTITKYNTTEELKVWTADGIVKDGSTPVVVEPTIEASDITGVAAAGVSNAKATVTISNADGYTVAVTKDNSVVTAASLNGSELTYTVSENTTTSARDGWITISLTKTGSTPVEKTITVSQLAASGGGPSDHVATIKFGSAQGSTKIEGKTASGTEAPFTYTDTGVDSQGNTWTITTVTSKEKSFTQSANYSQVGASKKPVTSITFTTTLSSSATIKSFSAKFGGFSGTAGNVSLKVGDTEVGTGSLDATNDVTVSATKTTEVGTVLTINVTGIDKGVKAYQIDVTYNN